MNRCFIGHNMDTMRALVDALAAAVQPGPGAQLASLRGQIAVAADALWAAANLEEDWQVELWGEDPLAKERRDRRAAEFAGAHAFARLAQATDS